MTPPIRSLVDARRLRLAAACLLSLAAPAPALAQEAVIELDRFGVGSVFRPGEWTAARFRITLVSGEPRQVQLSWEVENGDGDIAEHTRSLVLNPGQPALRWLSARLSPAIDSGTVFTVRVFEDDDGVRGRELGAARVSPDRASPQALMADIGWSLLGVFGDVRMNLDGYAPPPGGEGAPAGAHEGTLTASGLDTRELPDRWEGLSQFEALIWPHAGPNPVSPQSLELEEAEALREYLRRGGHLVIVLPQAGNPWGLGAPASHQLHDLLPSVAPRKVEDVPVAALLPILSKSDELRNPSAATSVQVFDPAKLDRGYEPCLALPTERDPLTGRPAPRPESLDGAVVGVQRRVGFGQITLLGIDVASIFEMRLQAGGLPQPDAFWNQVLGRRSDTPTPEHLTALSEAQPRRLAPGRHITRLLGSGALVSELIGMRGEATLGALLAFLLFAAYWALAGPVSYYGLKRMGKVRHAWMAFVAIGAIFTVVAWTSGALLRRGNVRIQHVTVLDHIARTPGAPPSEEPQWQRATSWFSAYLPGYGATEVAIESEPGQRDLLASWIAPPGASAERFPNVDRYVVPYGSPNAFSMPSRATATSMEARWLGVLDPAFGQLPYASDPSVPIREVITHTPAGPQVVLEGRLKHGLHGPLRDVKIIYASSIRTPLRRMVSASGLGAAQPATPGDLPRFGRLSSISVWAPGEEIDLTSALFQDSQRPGVTTHLAAGEGRAGLHTLHRTLRVLYLDDLGETDFTRLESSLDDLHRSRYFEMLGLFNMLTPPRWLDDGSQDDGGRVHFRRSLGRELDLSLWFTRPCLIITGFLEDDEPTEAPVPLLIGGERPPATGRTLVRWICPLPVLPDMVAPQPRAAAEEPERGGARAPRESGGRGGREADGDRARPGEGTRG